MIFFFNVPLWNYIKQEHLHIFLSNWVMISGKKLLLYIKKYILFCCRFEHHKQNDFYLTPQKQDEQILIQIRGCFPNVWNLIPLRKSSVCWSGDNCHKQCFVFLNSCMCEFPTILSETTTEQTQNVFLSGLWKAVIVLLGITYSSLGAIIGLKFCNEVSIIWLI